jgi:hypothetical protein
VARYLAELADGGKKTSTIQRRVSAIAGAHKAAGFEPPTNFEGVKAVMRGIRRRIGKRKRKVAPATAELLGLSHRRDSPTKARPARSRPGADRLRRPPSAVPSSWPSRSRTSSGGRAGS